MMGKQAASDRADTSVATQEDDVYRRLVEQSPMLICRFTPAGVLTFVNRAYATYFSRAPEDVVGKNISEFIPAESRDKALGAIQALTATNPALTHEHDVVEASGAVRRARWTTMAMLDAEGRVTAFQSIGEDVTEQSEMLQALRRNQARIESIYRAAPMGVGVARNRIIQSVNQRICEMTGYRADELVGQSGRLLYATQADYDYVGAEGYRQVAERGSGMVETRWRCKDGALMDIVLCSTALEPGNLDTGVTFAALDITQRKRAEEELRESEARFRALIDQAPAAIFVLDLNGRFVDVNERAAALLGYERRDLLTMSFTDIEEMQTHEAFWEALPEREHISYESEYRCCDGSTFPVEVRLGVITVGGARRIVAFATDISERRAAADEKAALEAQLRQVQKMDAIGQLAGGVAHDFNNVLTTILGNVELLSDLLSDRIGSDEPTSASLREIERAGQRAASLTRQLLLFSRRDITQPKTLHLNEMLAEMERMLRRLIPENIRLQLRRDENLAPIHADAGQIEQVIVNLVVNARDSMAQGGQIIITTKNVVVSEEEAAARPDARAGEHVRLTIADTGCGIAPDALEHIFEPFFTTKPVGTGTGLGLATAYGIVRGVQGHIDVDSAVGCGTTFHVYLPVQRDAKAEGRLENDELEVRGGAESILVVEDDPPVRSLTARILASAGYRVLAASDSHQALQLADDPDVHIDLLVSDVVMPDMDGKRLSEAIAAKRRDVRTLLVSGYASNVIAQHGVLEAGVELLEKPFSRACLLRRVREILDRARSNVAPPTT